MEAACVWAMSTGGSIHEGVGIHERTYRNAGRRPKIVTKITKEIPRAMSAIVAMVPIVMDANGNAVLSVDTSYACLVETSVLREVALEFVVAHGACASFSAAELMGSCLQRREHWSTRRM
jgi:hypothetical protein